MKLAMVAGNIIIDEAKIGGITPEVLIFNGRCVLWPPYIFRPTILFAYWTGIRRCPCSIKMINATTASMSMTRIRTAKMFNSPVDSSRNVFKMALGNRTTIPAKMISEIPLPMPRSVICSPSHMMNAVPAVRVMTVIIRNDQPGNSTTPIFSSPTLIPRP